VPRLNRDPLAPGSGANAREHTTGVVLLRRYLIRVNLRVSDPSPPKPHALALRPQEKLR